MYKYGCKTYTLNKQVRKGDKLAPYALIGHLVGYNLINIYQIWILSLYKVIQTRDIIFDETSFYNPKGQNIDYLLREALKDTIQAISLPEPLYEDKSEDKSILYRPTSNADQTTILNDLAELPIKDIEQLPTPSRTVSLDLLETNTIPGGL